jgi:hypothetical protein
MGARAPATALLAVLFLTGLGWSADAARPVVALPQVRSKVRVLHAGRMLLVETLLIENIARERLRVTCDRCRRYRTTVHETRPTHSSKYFRDINWLLPAGRDVVVEVTQRGHVGRFLQLAPSATGAVHLVFARTGCLGAHRRHIACPRGTKILAPETNVPTGPAQPGTTGTPTAPHTTAPPTASNPTAPHTSITSGPSGVESTGTATFAFSSDQANSTFSCQLDGNAAAPCNSGTVTFTNLALGVHSFTVTATGPAGLPDPAPPSRTWTRNPDPGTEYIADDANALAQSGAGWFGYTGGGAVNGQYKYFENFCPGDTYHDSGTWTITGLPDGVYNLYAYIPSNAPSRSGVAGNALPYGIPYLVQYRDGTAEVRVTQAGQLGNWIHIARLGFSGTSTVTLLDDDEQNYAAQGGSCYRKWIVADALKWTYEGYG